MNLQPSHLGQIEINSVAKNAGASRLIALAVDVGLFFKSDHLYMVRQNFAAMNASMDKERLLVVKDVVKKFFFLQILLAGPNFAAENADFILCQKPVLDVELNSKSDLVYLKLKNSVQRNARQAIGTKPILRKVLGAIGNIWQKN